MGEWQPLGGLQRGQLQGHNCARRLHIMINLEEEVKELDPGSNPEPLVCGCPLGSKGLRPDSLGYTLEPKRSLVALFNWAPSPERWNLGLSLQ